MPAKRPEPRVIEGRVIRLEPLLDEHLPELYELKNKLEAAASRANTGLQYNLARRNRNP